MKYVDPQEFRDLGLVAEINRLVLHPLGLALEVIVDDAGKAVGFGRVQDWRDDPEGVYFDDEQMAELAPSLGALGLERIRRNRARVDRLGYFVQPVPPA